MKVSKEIQTKMRKVAQLAQKSRELMTEIEAYLEEKGVCIDEIRNGNGCSLEELEYGTDVTDELVKRIEEEY